MEKEFVTYEIALALKELGFDEPCFGWYNYGELCLFGEDNLLDCYAREENRPLASTFSQAFRFFRENYDLESSIVFHEDYSHKGKINVYETNIEKRGENSRYFFTPIEGFITYEEAELECLKKLIEIINNGKD